MASPTPQQRMPGNNAIPQQQLQPQPQYAPQPAQAPVAALPQPQVLRSPTLSRKPVGRKAVMMPTNTAPLPIARPGSVVSTTPVASQLPTHVQVIGPTALQQQHQKVRTTPNAPSRPVHHSEAPVGSAVVQRPTQIQQQPPQQPQHPQQPHLAQQQTRAVQHGQSAAGAFSNSHHVQQITEAMTPPLPRRTTMPTLPREQPQQQQQPGPSTIFCSHCKTGIPSNVSTYTCLICSTANTRTYFCVWCFTSGAAATSHPHDRAYYVNESDLRIQLAPNSGVPTHVWTVRRNVVGTLWYTHNASGYSTHVRPRAAAVVEGSAGLAPGWDERRTPDGRTFFFNTTTGATSWVRPLYSLPPGWKELQTPDLVPFYVHQELGLASWERPGQQPSRGRRSSSNSGQYLAGGRQGAAYAGDSLKKMWGKLGKTRNLNKMARIATTVSNLADGNGDTDQGGFDADADFGGGVAMEEETAEEFPGEDGSGVDVQQDVYVDDAAFQQGGFAGQQEQPYAEVQQPLYEQPTNQQPIYEQQTYEQANIFYQQTYETGQPSLTQETFVTQESFGVSPEQEVLVQSQSPFTSPASGMLDSPYQQTFQQELMLDQPPTPQGQTQEQVTQPTQPFTPEEQIQISEATAGYVPQEQQQILVTSEVTVIEAGSDVTNNTAQVVDNSQLTIVNMSQTSAESNLMLANSQCSFLDTEQQVSVENASPPADAFPGPALTHPAQIQGETAPAICDVSSLSSGVQALDISAQDAASPPVLSEPVLAAEPLTSSSLEQKGASYSMALI